MVETNISEAPFGDIVKISKAVATFEAGKVYNIGISGEPVITGTAKRTGNVDVKWVQLWGSNWRMFTQAELHALLDSCNVTWTDNYKESGVKGRIFPGKGAYASSSIFLPASGDCHNGSVHYVGSFGSYRSSTPNIGSTELFVYYIFFNSNEASATEGGREYGFPVRAVLK